MKQHDYVRRGPLQWLWYAYGGSLPKRYREWVLHDITAPTWVLRHILRSTLQLAIPIIAVLALLPGPLSIRLLTVVAAGLPALLFTVMMIAPISEGRLLKAGYPTGYGDAIRSRRSQEKQAATARAYRERVAARRLARAARHS